VKIGIYLQDQDPEKGGSFTFENQILRAFLVLASQSKHEFTVLKGGYKDTFSLSQIDTFEQSFQGTSKSNLRYLSIFFFKRVKQIIPRLENLFRIVKAGQRRSIAKKLGLQLIWSISQGAYTQEVPYITPIFDLQHRLQPFFPEVSANGEWKERESIVCPLISQAAMLIVGTQVGKSEVELFYNASSERIRVIPFPTPLFDKQENKIDSRWIFKKYSLPDNYLFYPAQFWPHKNHANLLLAVFLLKKQFDLSVSVILVGSNKGNLGYIHELISQYNLLGQVKVLGFVPRSDLAALYENAIALTFVSFFGPDNLPPLEAFSLGCPVIAADVPGAQEQLGDAAKLVDPKNADHIALAIKAFWENAELRQTYIRKGHERASQWSAQDYVQEVFKLFDELEPILSCW
jgi:glycosyltransferase involved in cell wall biosynthesis